MNDTKHSNNTQRPSNCRWCKANKSKSFDALFLILACRYLFFFFRLTLQNNLLLRSCSKSSRSRRSWTLLFVEKHFSRNVLIAGHVFDWENRNWHRKFFSACFHIVLSLFKFYLQFRFLLEFRNNFHMWFL